MWYHYLIALDSPFPRVGADGFTLRNILEVVFSLVGAVCALLVTYGGLKFVLSRGEPAEVAKSKNTILYALVGLIITLSAGIIVNFIILNAT
jgi:hypothetical protein